MQLTQLELRVIGCLIEKSLTTPEQYPLSLNSLTSACNQKSNRDPVLSLTETEVQQVVDQLTEKRLVFVQSGNSSRVPKYKHRFCNSEFGDLQLSPQELAITCVLFLRGPQTPGELRTRTNRLCSFKDVTETDAVLNEMENPENGPFVEKLIREPGKRESRFMHCFGDQVEIIESHNDDSTVLKSITIPQPSEDKRFELLEEQVELMQLEIDELREKLELLLN